MTDEGPATEVDEGAARDEAEQDDAVWQLARALRAARRAHSAYLAELRQADVEPLVDWSMWYADYLLGPR